MSKEIYNEGRVVGFSAYELYVKNAIASGLDPESGDIATEREWLGSMLAMGASMIVEVPSFNGKFVDIPLPSNTRLCAANTIIASFFDGEAVFEDHWATKVMRYNPVVANNATIYPSGEVEATNIPHMNGQTGEYTRTYLKKFQDYLKIDKGVILQGGEWTESQDYGLQEIEPHYDLTKVQVDNKAGEPSPVPVLRLYVNEGGTSITSNPMILLTGFTDRNILRGTAVLSGGSADPMTNDYANGGFLGPGIFPWCTPIVFTLPANYMKYLSGIRKSDVVVNIDSMYTIVDVHADLETIYDDESASIYSYYCYDTPTDPAGIDLIYTYLSSPTHYTNVLTLHTTDETLFPPALYVSVQEPVQDGDRITRHQYPVDVVAPGTVKMFKVSDPTDYYYTIQAMKSYEAAYVGTTALFVDYRGCIGIQQSGIDTPYYLNAIISNDDTVTVTRDAHNGAWDLSVDVTGQVNVAVDSSTKTLTVTPSTSQGVKTFTIKDIQTFEAGAGIDINTTNEKTTISASRITGGNGIDVTTDSSTQMMRINSKIVAGTGISIERNSNNQYVVTNTRPVLTSSDLTDVDHTGYRVYFSPASKYLKQTGVTNTYLQKSGFFTGMKRSNLSSNTYDWKSNVDTSQDSGDTLHRSKIGLRYAISRSSVSPISGILRFSDNVQIDAGDPSATPTAYSTSTTYYAYAYCTYSGKKYRCISSGADGQGISGNFNTKFWKEVTACVIDYDSSTSYLPGDYCMRNGSQKRCIQATTGSYDSAKWVDDTTILPTVAYNLSICDSLSTDTGSPISTSLANAFMFNHGTARNEAETITISSTDYNWYQYDRSLVARICLTKETCKQIFLGDPNYVFDPTAEILIDAPTSGVSGSEVANWVAYNSSSQSISNTRLSYPITYRVWCRYPFIVHNGEILFATNQNISDVNRGSLRTLFGSAVNYDLERDEYGRTLGDTGARTYQNFAMIFDITAEIVGDGINKQMENLIAYEGNPTGVYTIASPSTHMTTDINIRINSFTL